MAFSEGTSSNVHGIVSFGLDANTFFEEEDIFAHEEEEVDSIADVYEGIADTELGNIVNENEQNLHIIPEDEDTIDNGSISEGYQISDESSSDEAEEPQDIFFDDLIGDNHIFNEDENVDQEVDTNDLISYEEDESKSEQMNDSIFEKIDNIDSEIRQDIEHGTEILRQDDEEEESSDDNSDEGSQSTRMIRPRRAVTGRGINRLEVNFNKKVYDSKRQYQFLMKEVQSTRANDNQSYVQRALGVLFTQMSARSGIKKHGEYAIAALVKEFKQLVVGAMNGKPVVVAVNYDSLTEKEKRRLWKP